MSSETNIITRYVAVDTVGAYVHEGSAATPEEAAAACDAFLDESDAEVLAEGGTPDARNVVIITVSGPADAVHLLSKWIG